MQERFFKNARVIILDEATAYADPENEYSPFKVLSKQALAKEKNSWQWQSFVQCLTSPGTRSDHSWWKVERICRLRRAKEASVQETALHQRDYGGLCEFNSEIWWKEDFNMFSIMQRILRLSGKVSFRRIVGLIFNALNSLALPLYFLWCY